MAITNCRAKPRGHAMPFDVSTFGVPPMPSEHFQIYEVTSAPGSWAPSGCHWCLRPGDRILVDWSHRPDKGVIGAIRQQGGGVCFTLFDGDESRTQRSLCRH